MSQSSSSISETELEVLKVLWEHHQGTVREIQQLLQKQEIEGRNWAYTTVQTLLNRLEAKQVVRIVRGGPAHVYQPTVSRDQLLQQRLGDLAEQLCEGTSSPLVLALVEGGRFTKEEIEKFRKLLDQLEVEPEANGGQ